MKIKIQCPAKVNLTLKVVGKRPDGFHNIESIMQTIDLYDYLTIEKSPAEKFEIVLSGNSKEIPYNEKNLVYKAAKLFFETVSSPSPQPSPQGGEGEHPNYKISIYIEKNIPVAAGLAGGSTDAAGTLFGLNELFEKPLNKKELHELCAKLGSDLNVCLEGGRLMTKGRGEIIEPMEFEEFNLSLIKPKDLGISAKEAYTKFSEKNNKCHSEPACKQILRFAQNDVKGEESHKTRDYFLNDLEWAIIDDYKELQKIKTLYPNSMMSGSGSTYFEIGGEFESLDGYEIYNNHKTIDKGVCIVKDLL